MKNFLNKKNKGFTLLFAMLVATLVLSIGATIISIALRQTILSGTSRESQYAFYAANTALECAFYWDTTNNPVLNGKKVFSDPDGDPEFDITNQEIPNITCSGINIVDGNGDDISPWSIDIIDANTTATTFYLKIKNLANITGVQNYEYCAEAKVTKEVRNSGANIRTVIETKGYNTCDEDNPRRVERGLIQQYDA